MQQDIEQVFASYSAPIKTALLAVRALLLETANEQQKTVIESLKWRQPSFSCKGGSPVRLGPASAPFDYGVYFHCQTRLVDTFRQLYPGQFHFAGNRALLFHLSESPDWPALRHCL